MKAGQRCRRLNQNPKRVRGKGRGAITPYPSPLAPCYTAFRVFNYDNQEFCALARCGFSGGGPGLWRRAARAATCRASASARAGRRPRRAEPDLPDIGQPRQLGRHRPQPARAVPGRPHERRFRGLRGRRQAGAQFVYARARRPRVPDADSDGGAGTRRHHPAAVAPGERRRRPHHHLRHRRSSPRVPRHASRAAPLPRHGERARARRRSLRHRLDRHVVDCDRSDLRPHAHGRGGQQDYRRRVEALRNHSAVVDGRDAAGSHAPRERRVRDRVRHAEQPAADAASPQGGRADQQRLRFRSVRLVARGHRRQRLPEQPQRRSERSVRTRR